MHVASTKSTLSYATALRRYVVQATAAAAELDML